MPRYRLSARSGRIGPKIESRYERIVVVGMIVAAILLAFADSDPSITRSSAWAISYRFSSTDLALTSFLKQAGQPSTSTSLVELPLIRRSSSVAWGGRASDLDFRSSQSAPHSDAFGSTGGVDDADPSLAPAVEASRTLAHEDGDHTRITSGFGFRRLGGYVRHHDGVDIALPYGAPIRAYAEGTVVFAGWRNGYGQLVVIEHGNGKETYYAHASALRARAGDRVSRNDVIGYVGATGRAFGPHLHFEIRLGGVPVDPEQEYLSHQVVDPV